jgi:hypothetical protein
VLAPATLAALPSTRAIPDRDVFYVAPRVRSILTSSQDRQNSEIHFETATACDRSAVVNLLRNSERFGDLEKIHQRVSRLRENAKAASLKLPPETVAKLDAIGTNKA